MEIKIHGVPVIIADVDNENQTLGGANKSYKELRDGWIDYLSTSDAVKSRIHKIKRMEIGTLAHFYWKDAKIQFQCNKYSRSTCIERCEGCIDWSLEDMRCSGGYDGNYIELPEKSKDMALDTMHLLRIILK